MKAKRFLAMLLMGCLAVLTLFSFVGCGKKDPVKEALSKGEKIPYVESSVDLHNRVSLEKKIEIIIRNRNDLLTTIENCVTFYGEEETWDNYDDNFFKNKSLILYFGSRADGSIQREIAGVVLREQALVVIYTERPLYDNIIFHYSWVNFSILEVDKKRVETAETVELQFIKLSSIYGEAE